jgi:hypothetical protein
MVTHPRTRIRWSVLPAVLAVIGFGPASFAQEVDRNVVRLE